MYKSKYICEYRVEEIFLHICKSGLATSGSRTLHIYRQNKILISIC